MNFWSCKRKLEATCLKEVSKKVDSGLQSVHPVHLWNCTFEFALSPWNSPVLTSCASHRLCNGELSLPLPFPLTEAVPEGCSWRPEGSSLSQVRVILSTILWATLWKEKPPSTHLQIWVVAGCERWRPGVSKCLLKPVSSWYSWGFKRCY